MKSSTLIRIIGGAVALIAALALVRQLPVETWLPALATWVRELGAIGVLVFGVLYVAAVVALIPGSLLTLAAGALYGPIWGTVLVSATSITGATVAFLLGRTVARDWIRARVADRPAFSRAEAAIEERGALIVGLMRLSPVFPFSLLNYALGLTSVRLRDYVLASWIGMLPGTFMFVYLGSLVDDIARLASGDVGEQGFLRYALLGVGLLATVAVTVILGRIARRAIAEAGDYSDPPDSTTTG